MRLDAHFLFRRSRGDIPEGHCRSHDERGRLLNVAVAAEIWKTGRIPPCIGEGPVLDNLKLADGKMTVEPAGRVLVLASGFGGNNVAVVIG